MRNLCNGIRRSFILSVTKTVEFEPVNNIIHYILCPGSDIVNRWALWTSAYFRDSIKMYFMFRSRHSYYREADIDKSRDFNYEPRNISSYWYCTLKARLEDRCFFLPNFPSLLFYGSPDSYIFLLCLVAQVFLILHETSFPFFSFRSCHIIIAIFKPRENTIRRSDCLLP